jgi:ABC-type maltose transport system permease subunit
MIAILSALAPLFLITALGYALAALKFAGPGRWRAELMAQIIIFQSHASTATLPLFHLAGAKPIRVVFCNHRSCRRAVDGDE